MRFGATTIFLLGLLLTPALSRAQEAKPSEYQIKAAFVFNFAKFVEWPPEGLATATAPIIIGVSGDNPFKADLEQTVRNKSINEHPLQVKEFRLITEVAGCHLLFISSSEKARLQEILASLGRSSVLTVSEMDSFTEGGGMIGFVKESKKIRFRINEPAARKSNLKVSSKLLSLALPPSS